MRNFYDSSNSKSQISPVSFMSTFHRISENEYHEKIKKILIQEYINKNLYIFPKYNLNLYLNKDLNSVKIIREIFLTEYKKQLEKYF